MAKIDSSAVQSVLYGVYKSLHKIAGASSPAIMRQAAPDILAGLSKFGDGIPVVSNVEELEKAVHDTMVGAGCCDEITFALDDGELTCNIRGCAFADLTAALGSEDIPPFGCPFAALTLAIAQQNLGKKPRVTHLGPTQGGGKGDTTLKVKLT